MGEGVALIPLPHGSPSMEPCRSIKKSSDYLQLTHMEDYAQQELEKRIAYARGHHQYMRYCEVEGETLFDRRQIYDW